MDDLYKTATQLENERFSRIQELEMENLRLRMRVQTLERIIQRASQMRSEYNDDQRSND